MSRSATWSMWVLFLSPGLAAQDSKGEIDLSAKPPASSIVAYDVLEASKGTKLFEFHLFGWERARGVSVNEPSDLGFRYVFRWPSGKLKTNSVQEVDEEAFGKSLNALPSTLRIKGAYRIVGVKKARIEDIIKTAKGKRGEKADQVDLVLVEGRFELSTCRTVNGAKAVDKKPTAFLSTLACIRQADGVMMGGRIVWTGRIERYLKLDDTSPGKVPDPIEVVARDDPYEATAENLRERIDKAIKAGTTWLRSRQDGSGRFTDMAAYFGLEDTDVGATALAVLALLHSGVQVNEPVISKGFAALGQGRITQAYSVALLIMALEGKYLPLESYQDRQQFSEATAREHLASKITPTDRDRVKQAAKWLIETQLKDGSWGYGARGETANLSCVQYALMGLKSASRMGIEVPSGVWRRATEYVLSGAETLPKEVRIRGAFLSGATFDRSVRPIGWGYYCGPAKAVWPEITASLTLAAIASLTICDSELHRMKALDDGLEDRVSKAVWGGLAWFHENYDIRASRPEGAWIGNALLFYYLYGMERAGVFLGLKTIGDHDWYLEGATQIVGWQRGDGRWEGPNSTPIIDTAFALLFLKRATIPVTTPRGVASVDDRKPGAAPQEER